MAVLNPKASRPYIPEYGIPDTEDGMIDWSWVETQMKPALVYWLASVNPNGTPHTVPTWGAWVQGKLYFGGGDKTRHTRNLTHNPNAVAHLESGHEVVIMEGSAQRIVFADLDHAIQAEITADYVQKYGAGEGANFAFTPRKAFAWTTFPTTPTRFTFE